MNAEFINPFVQGAQNILGMVCNEGPTLGGLFLKKYPYVCESVSICIGIVGDIEGHVIYTMKTDSACSIASKMMYGMPVPELDEMSQSAISELGNMISGNVATAFSGFGKQIDITPPQFLLNAVTGNFPFINAQSKVVCVPLKFSDGNIFEVDILFKE